MGATLGIFGGLCFGKFVRKFNVKGVEMGVIFRPGFGVYLGPNSESTLGPKFGPTLVPNLSPFGIDFWCLLWSGFDSILEPILVTTWDVVRLGWGVA